MIDTGSLIQIVFKQYQYLIAHVGGRFPRANDLSNHSIGAKFEMGTWSRCIVDSTDVLPERSEFDKRGPQINSPGANTKDSSFAAALFAINMQSAPWLSSQPTSVSTPSTIHHP
jgi:hypothetical protein